ncbi:hypothetical protein [Actinotalea sp. Marseille-Q4924]|uniref:hypothetical protein n=1 Tax=Actinotalea sp. Marseille-Q4924 TaxID=2866571 RepID=UPI001CE426D3|nr:hypothetical protein [Actinotalea sp. Marseille-Q4924]
MTTPAAADARPATPVPSPVVRPIHFVTDVPRWRAFYLDLGLEATGVDADGWTVLAAGSGRLALHHADPGDRVAGRALLRWEVADLGAYRDAVVDAGVPVRELVTADGPALALDLPAVGRVQVDPAEVDDGGAPVDPEALSVVGLHYTDATTAAAASAARVGWLRRITSETGTWADLVAGGVLAFHDGDRVLVNSEPVCEVALEVGDLRPVHARALAAGHEVVLVDEAYGRALRVRTPSGTELWVNETQRDLYGYRLESASTAPSDPHPSV